MSTPSHDEIASTWRHYMDVYLPGSYEDLELKKKTFLLNYIDRYVQNPGFHFFRSYGSQQCTTCRLPVGDVYGDSRGRECACLPLAEGSTEALLQMSVIHTIEHMRKQTFVPRRRKPVRSYRYTPREDTGDRQTRRRPRSRYRYDPTGRPPHRRRVSASHRVTGDRGRRRPRDNATESYAESPTYEPSSPSYVPRPASDEDDSRGVLSREV